MHTLFCSLLPVMEMLGILFLVLSQHSVHSYCHHVELVPPILLNLCPLTNYISLFGKFPKFFQYFLCIFLA